MPGKRLLIFTILFLAEKYGQSLPVDSCLLDELLEFFRYDSLQTIFDDINNFFESRLEQAPSDNIGNRIKFSRDDFIFNFNAFIKTSFDDFNFRFITELHDDLNISVKEKHIREKNILLRLPLIQFLEKVPDYFFSTLLNEDEAKVIEYEPLLSFYIVSSFFKLMYSDLFRKMLDVEALISALECDNDVAIFAGLLHTENIACWLLPEGFVIENAKGINSSSYFRDKGLTENSTDLSEYLLARPLSNEEFDCLI